MVSDPSCRRLGRSLSHCSTVSFEIGVRARIPSSLENVHWVYVPDRSTPGVPSGSLLEYLPGHGPPPTAIACTPKWGLTRPARLSSAFSTDLRADVISFLSRSGWVDPRRIRTTVTHLIPCSYVHFTPKRNDTVQRIHAILKESGVTCVGRYGLLGLYRDGRLHRRGDLCGRGHLLMNLSVVIPAHNEAPNIRCFVTDFLDSLPEPLKARRPGSGVG